jgi:hypothetical protein
MQGDKESGGLLAGRVWSLAAILCLTVAAVFLWLNHLSTAFVMAALGVVSWFIGYRNQLRKNIIPAETETDDEEDGTEDADES